MIDLWDGGVIPLFIDSPRLSTNQWVSLEPHWTIIYHFAWLFFPAIDQYWLLTNNTAVTNQQYSRPLLVPIFAGYCYYWAFIAMHNCLSTQQIGGIIPYQLATMNHKYWLLLIAVYCCWFTTIHHHPPASTSTSTGRQCSPRRNKLVRSTLRRAAGTPSLCGPWGISTSVSAARWAYPGGCMLQQLLPINWSFKSCFFGESMLMNFAGFNM